MTLSLILLQVPTSTTSPLQYVIGSIITVICLLGVEELKNYLAKRREKRNEEKKLECIDNTLKHNNEIQRKIKEVLIQLQGYTECSRACLYAYHNGTKTHFGFSMNFVSMIEEKTDGIVAPLLDSFQSVPAGYYRAVLDKVNDAKEGYAVIETDKLAEDDRKMLEKYQIAMSYDFKVGGTIYEGIVSLVWVNKKHYLSEGEVTHIQTLINQVYDLQKEIIKLPKP